MASTDKEAEQDLWLFGYGEDHRGTPSAPGRVVTLIPRAHWESLTDSHPTAPPRVWGAAYRIPAVHVRETKELLDIREINGYTVDFAAFHVPVHVRSAVSTSSSTSTSAKAPTAPVADSSSANHPPAQPITCLVYIGLPSNPQFLGPQDPDALAAHIVRSTGPSGENREYVYELERALEELRVQAGEVEVDGHVSDLAGRVREAERRLEREGG
ncbi:MAG: hypothetical protein M1828_004294 [Chrysothrix sp. TS-e1954]|nr:MAG: hypothetical protein M1828_004294 [Chrysothrix sp. TS-e1954]